MNWTARPQGQKYQSVCTFIHVFHGLKPFKKKEKEKRKRKKSSLVRACPVPPYNPPAVSNDTTIKADH
jgi:DNA topoisomerase IB